MLFCNPYSVFYHLYTLAFGKHNSQTGLPINNLLILPSCNTFKYDIKGPFVFHSYFNEIFSSFALRNKNRMGYPPILKSYGEINYCHCIFEKHHFYHNSSNFNTILYIPNFLFFLFVCMYVCMYL